jgi:ubiquinone biosynthesis accessory factor UbiJ
VEIFLILESCQRLLNRSIQDSAVARRELERLDGESLRIEIDGLALRLIVSARDGELAMSLGDGANASAALTAGPLELARLAGPGAIGRIGAGNATLTGRLEVAEGFAEVFRLVDPDFEEELSRWVGDIAAHRIGSAARGLAAWVRRAVRAVEADLSEYLHEEGRLLPRSAETAEWSEGVDRLRDAVERAEQRLERLCRLAAAGD